jgi:predicted protein tyrosine phosphatase
MEARHRDYLEEKFPEALAGRRVICLRIPDDYGYNDPDLIEMLKFSLSPHLPVPP